MLGSFEILEWTVVTPEAEQGRRSPRSLLRLETVWEGHPVRVLFVSQAPAEAGPAIRRFADGTCELL